MDAGNVVLPVTYWLASLSWSVAFASYEETSLASLHISESFHGVRDEFLSLRVHSFRFPLNLLQWASIFLSWPVTIQVEKIFFRAFRFE